MKISLYELLGMIKDNKAPQKIKLDNQVFEYNERERDYQCQENDDDVWDEYLFEDYTWKDDLDKEVEILETTITFKQETSKIEKLELYKSNDIEFYNNKEMGDKINEIIEVLNER